MRKPPFPRSFFAAFALLCFAAFFLRFPGTARAQSPSDSKGGGGISAEDAAAFGEASAPIAALRGDTNKTLIFVFDVSGSMRDGGNLRRARAATINILKEGTRSGDHVALLTFGSGYKKVFDTTLGSRADLADLVAQVPTATEDGAGTNIRKPHHEALKIIDAGLPRPGVIVLLTDSFNDEPKASGPDYNDYLRYYTPGGQLTKYPRTPENRDYERLLAKLLRSGKLRQYGIGIKIDDNGRPIERLPQAAPPPFEAPAENAPVSTPIPPAKGTNPLVYLLGLLGLGAVGALWATVIRPMTASTALRITGGSAGSKDFALKSGQTIRLGGEGASAAYDAYALSAASREPVARIKSVRGQLVISPVPSAPAKNTPGTSNPEGGLRVYHNGLVLKADSPLGYGDEVRVSVPPAPDSPGGIAKEYRLRFEDPRKSF